MCIRDRPNTSSNRIANQFGYFTVHTDPKTPLNKDTSDAYLEKLIIPANMKKDIVYMLNHYGINYLSLFPDLDGLSRHLSWFAENSTFWNNTFDENEIEDGK